MLIFQLGPSAPWLADALRGVSPVPWGGVAGHEIFNIPGFPAGTDFKTLVLHGRNARPPAGLDMATIGDGYVYHTPLDDPSRIGAGAIGEYGASLLSVASAMGLALQRQLAAEARSPRLPHMGVLLSTYGASS